MNGAPAGTRSSNNERIEHEEIYMCIFCSAIPAAAAVGAKLNADERQKPEEQRKPIGKLTVLVIALLAMASAVYHTMIWRS